MRNLSMVEWRTWNRIPREPPVLRESRQFKFNLHGEVERFGFGGNGLPEVDAVGENLTWNAWTWKGGLQKARRMRRTPI